MRKEFKFKPILGELPEMGFTDWWTEEDWSKYNEYVERLKAEGKYLTEGEEVTIHYEEDDFKAFVDDRPFEEKFKGFGLYVPK